jgi:hypothetical protein
MHSHVINSQNKKKSLAPWKTTSGREENQEAFISDPLK